MPTFHSTIDTLGKLKEDGYRLWGHCGAQFCGHADILPLDRLIERYGPDYGFIGETQIARSIVCSVCEHRGGSIRLGSPDTRPFLEEQARHKQKGR